MEGAAANNAPSSEAALGNIMIFMVLLEGPAGIHSFNVSVNCVVSVSPPPEPVRVMINWPDGVEDEVEMVRLGEKVGVPVQVGCCIQPLTNLGDDPLGYPLIMRVTS